MMTRQKKLFCEYYITTHNATEAAKLAGFKESTAKYMGSNLLRNEEIKDYIKSIVEEQDAALVCQTDELLRILSRIARGEEKEQVLMTVNIGDFQQEVQQWERRAIPKDRLKAIELLGKYLGMWDNRKLDNLENHNITITFEDRKQIEYKPKD